MRFSRVARSTGSGSGFNRSSFIVISWCARRESNPLCAEARVVYSHTPVHRVRRVFHVKRKKPPRFPWAAGPNHVVSRGGLAALGTLHARDGKHEIIGAGGRTRVERQVPLLPQPMRPSGLFDLSCHSLYPCACARPSASGEGKAGPCQEAPPKKLRSLVVLRHYDVAEVAAARALRVMPVANDLRCTGLAPSITGEFHLHRCTAGTSRNG